MVPSERRELRDQRLVDRHPSGPHLAKGSAEVATVEEYDGGGHEIEGSGPGLLVLMTAITEAAKAMDGTLRRGQGYSSLPPC
jgi:hypothetical protein